jgi:hypothetical protein
MHYSNEKRNTKIGLNHKIGNHQADHSAKAENPKVSYAQYFNMAQRRAHVIRMYADDRLGLGAKAIGAYLIEVRINAKSGIGREKIKNIAKNTACCETTVKNAIRALLQFGYLVQVSRGSYFGKKASEYALPASIKDATIGAPECLPTGTIQAPECPPYGHPDALHRDARTPLRGAPEYPPTDTLTDTRTDNRTGRGDSFSREERHGVREALLNHGAKPSDLEIEGRRQTAAAPTMPPQPVPTTSAMYLRAGIAIVFKRSYDSAPERLRQLMVREPPDLHLASRWPVASRQQSDALEAMIKQKLQEAIQKGEPITSVEFFQSEIIATLQEHWRQALETYRRARLWAQEDGPPPSNPYCYAPNDLLIEFGHRKSEPRRE